MTKKQIGEKLLELLKENNAELQRQYNAQDGNYDNNMHASSSSGIDFKATIAAFANILIEPALEDADCEPIKQ